MQVEVVTVGWPGSTTSALFQAAFEFGEHAQRIRQVNIRVQHETLQQIPVFVLWPLSPKSVMKVFVSLSDFTTESQVSRTLLVQGDVFDRVEPFGLAALVA